MSVETNGLMTLRQIVTSVKRGASSSYLKGGDREMQVIKAKDITEDGSIAFSQVDWEQVKFSERVERNVLHAGDILLSLRGSLFKILVVPPEAEGMSFAANFVALSVDTSVLSPEIVAWYLRSEQVVQYLRGKATGAVILSVSLDDVLSLPICIPSSDQQAEILEFLHLKRDVCQNAAAQMALLDRISDELLRVYLREGQV